MTIKFNKKKFKNFILILLVVIVAFLLGTQKTKALSSRSVDLTDFIYDTDNMTFIFSESNNFKTILDETIDVLNEKGLHYSIYLKGKKQANGIVIYDSYYIFINDKYDSGYIYNKFATYYNSTYTDGYTLGLSSNLNNYTSSWNSSYNMYYQSPSYSITNMLDAVGTKIDLQNASYYTASSISKGTTFSHMPSSNSTFTDPYTSEIINTRDQMTESYYVVVPYYSTEPIYYVDHLSQSYRIFYDNGEELSYISSGDLMPQLYSTIINNEPEPIEVIPTTSTEIFEKTGKNISQNAINNCYENNRPYMVVYSEGTTQYIGNYALLCSSSPIAYIKQENTWGQGYHFTFYDIDNDIFSVTNGTVSKAMYTNGNTLCYDYTNVCGQWGRTNYFTFYYSNFDIVYFPEGSEASLRGQTKYACNAESCISLASNEYIGVIEPEPEPETEPDPEIIKNDYTYTGKQLFSVDFNLNTSINDNYFEIELDYDEYKPIFDSIVYLGLVNNNGLYTWQEIPFVSGLYSVDDIVEKYENGVYNLKIKKISLAKSNYDKLMIKVNLKNAIDCSNIKVGANDGLITSNNVNLNSFGYTYLSQTFNTSNFKYINFSTNVGEYNNPFYLQNLNSDVVFEEYFDTFNGLWVEYGTPLRVYNPELYNKTKIDRFEVAIGKDNRRGFWLTYNVNDNVNIDFETIYVYQNIHYSFSNSKTNDDTVYIDNDGNIINGDLKPSDDLVVNDYNSFSGIVNSVKKFIVSIATYTTAIRDMMFYLFNSLNVYVKGLIVSLFMILIMGTIIKISRR